MSRPGNDVVVVGAGLAGLTCAVELSAAGLEVRVLESGDAVGGRIRTDHVDGFTLDRGFQVLNTAYPALDGLVDLDALDLRAFDASVGVLLDGRRVTVGNPLQDPRTLVPTLRAPLGGVVGKATLGAYAAQCVALPASTLRRREDVSAAEAWRRARIPQDVVDGLLRPFLSGVVLEDEMSTSRRFTDLMVKTFARGRSTVPARGMQALPEQVASRLPEGAVQLSSEVGRVAATGVEGPGGALASRAVVVATDGWSASRLLRGAVAEPAPRGVTTVYHEAPEDPGLTGSLLLDGGPSPVANSIAISVAAASYAPEGRVLVSTSIVHGRTGARSGPVADGPELRAALSRLHGTDAAGWRMVAAYDLPRALPGMPAPHPMRTPVRLTGAEGVLYVAGDPRDTSSIQGDIVSGRRAARAVLTDLGARRSRAPGRARSAAPRASG